MKRLHWELQRLWRAIGLAGWVGVALLFACSVAWRVALLPLRADTDRLRAERAAIESRLASSTSATTSQLSTPQQQLEAFGRRFTGAKGIAASLVRLQASAGRQGVHLDQAEFKFASDVGEPLLRYTIVLPVKADYLALRRFTRDALLELPGLAIEEVNLRRSDPKSATLEAQLRFVLFLSRSD